MDTDIVFFTVEVMIYVMVWCIY